MGWSRKRRRWVVYGWLVAAYAFLMIFGGCASKLILFPSRQPISARPAKAVRVERGDEKGVECWVDQSAGVRLDAGGVPRAFVIAFTGNATRAEQVASDEAAMWGRHAVEAWTMNYPGYGGSDGKAELNAIGPAALAVYDEVSRRAAGRPIFLSGSSLGTTAALYVAAQRPVAGLILHNPPAIRSLLLRKFGWWNLWLIAGPVALQVPVELDSPTNAAKVKAPAIFILADDDDFVVPSNQMRVVKAYAGRKTEIHTLGGHNGGLDGRAEAQLHDAIDALWIEAGVK